MTRSNDMDSRRAAPVFSCCKYIITYKSNVLALEGLLFKSWKICDFRNGALDTYLINVKHRRIWIARLCGVDANSYAEKLASEFEGY